MIFDEESKLDFAGGATMVDPGDSNRQKLFHSDSQSSNLLVPVFRGGSNIYPQPTLETIRQRVRDQLQRTPSAVKRFENPHSYAVGLEQSLHELKTAMIQAARGQS